MPPAWILFAVSLVALLAAPCRAEEPPDMAVLSLTSRPALEGHYVEIETAGLPAEGATLEVLDGAGTTHRRHMAGPGEGRLALTLPAPAVSASLDPDRERADADRYNNHFPRKWHVTPWPSGPQDAYTLRYFPGLTFKQGQAPVRPRGAPMMPPAQGPMGLGLGLEGRLAGAHGWQVLTNFGASPFAPSLDPRFSLHGYVLPHPNWGLDGDVSLDLRGTVATEFGTSLIMWEGPGGPADGAVLAHQLRLALGNQALATGSYPYGQLTLFRDDTAHWGVASNMSIFGGLDGGWRALMEGQHTRRYGRALGLRLSASAGLSGGPLPAANRLSAGLASHDWQPALGRLGGKCALIAPIARGLDMPIGPVASLRQIEGSAYVEGAGLVAPSGAMAGLGLEITLVQDTLLGMPIAMNMGYAMPVWGLSGPRSPWPGRIYVMTTDAFFR